MKFHDWFKHLIWQYEVGSWKSEGLELEFEGGYPVF